MNAVDAIILTVLLLSVLVGLFRGLISEVLSLVTWAVAFWVAWTFGPMVSEHFAKTIPTPTLRFTAGYGICFIAMLVVGALVRFVVRRVVDGTGLGGTDRLLGMLFGFGRGLLLVALMVFLVGLTPLTHEPMVQQSSLMPQFNGIATWLEQELPSNVRHLQPPSLNFPDHLNIPDHLKNLPNLQNVLPAALPSHGFSSPAAASSAANATHYSNG